jgi:hypothetical protein
MKNKRMSQFVTSSVLASTLVFSLGAGAAFANEDETQATETTIEQVEIVTEGTTTTSEDTTTGVETEETNTGEVTEPTTEEAGTDEELEIEEATTDSESADVSVEEETEAPSLVPGDFFYFVKLMSEKIRLAFTFDDYKEAKLLADFAAERIAEANSLIADGKSEEAAELLKAAIETQEQVNEVIPESEEAPEVVTNVTDGEETEAATPETDSEATEVEKKLAHNIDALMVVLAKVENPKAQQAIMKNIQKSFVKLDKKITKIEEKQAKLAKKKNKMEEEPSEDVAGEIVSQPEGELNTNQELVIEEGNNSVEVQATTAAPNTTTKQQEAVKKAEEMKQAAAQKAEEMKQEATRRAEEMKQAAIRKAEEKQQQAAQKAQEKQQQAAQKAHGKQNGAGGKAEGKGNN